VLAAELTDFYEYAMCRKWLALLKELAPSVARVAVLQNPDHPSWAGYRQSIATAAPSLGVEAIASGVRSPAEIRHRDRRIGTRASGRAAVPA
jgi:ABC-type uncharacterized transport system substrate-binding protein